ncbi:MAG: tetratricopeptide repeat protein [bacterium]
MRNTPFSILCAVLLLPYLQVVDSFSQSFSSSKNLLKSRPHTADTDSIFNKYSDEELEKFLQEYNQETEKLLNENDRLRLETIQELEAFVNKHPDSPVIDKVIFRLANLQYEKAVQDYGTANDKYNQQLNLYERGKIKQPPIEPKLDYSKPLSLCQKIIDRFPDSPYLDDAIYNKGFLLQELGEPEEAFHIFQELREKYPDSPYIPDALMIMAEYYFNPPVSDIEKSIEIYNQVLQYKTSSKYDAALYRLGWAYYRLSDYPAAISYFTTLADDIDLVQEMDPDKKYHFPEVREEAIEYIGISFFDFGGPSQAAKYFDIIGGREYSFDVLKKIGDLFLNEKEEYDKAIESYQLLLSLYPNSPNAPTIQANITEAYRRKKDEQMVYARRSELFKKYNFEGDWWKNTRDLTAKTEAISLAEKALRENINYILSTAEESNDPALYQQAIQDSRDYLKTFPSDSHAVQIHWNIALTLDSKLGKTEEAFEEYIKISNLYLNTDLQKLAAENAIAIWDEAIQTRSAEKSGPELQMGKEISRQELSAEEKKLAFALDNYIRLFPHEPGTAKILARAGALYYEKHQFTESLMYNKTLLKHFPDSPEARDAQFVIMESYFGKGDFESTEIIAKRLRNEDPQYRTKATARLAESIFLKAKAYSGSSQHVMAAEEYLRVLQEAPTAEFADLALYNSAIEYKKASEFEKAVTSYKLLIQNYPNSKHYLNALNNLAFDYREMKDFHKAAVTYEKLANLQTDEKQAEIALYNASVSYVEAEDWQQAIRINTRFVERFPKAEDADNLLFNNASYYLKLNDIQQANKIYDEFARKYPDSPGVVEALFHRGKYFLDNNRTVEAKTEFEKAINKNNYLKQRDRPTNDFFAVEALYQLTKIKFKEFQSIRFNISPQYVVQNKAKKKAMLLDLLDNYGKVISAGTIRLYEATYCQGLAYEEFAKTWAEQEIFTTNDNQRILAQKEVNKVSAELFEKAVKTYKEGVKTLTKISDSYRKSVAANNHDDYSRTKISDDSTLSVAEGWIEKCQNKISENLYAIAEINDKTVSQLLTAINPPGLDKLELLIYRNQLIEKVISPVLREITDAHIRNIQEGRALDLDNPWIEKSKKKLLAAGTISAQEFQKISFGALNAYGDLIESYKRVVKSGDEAAFDVAEQMLNYLDLSRKTAASMIQSYRENIQQVRKLNIQTPEAKRAEENVMKAVFNFSTIADSLALMANAQRLYFQELFKNTDNTDFDEASLNFDEQYFALVDGSQEVLENGLTIGQEFKLNNQWSRKIILALVMKKPEEFANKLKLNIETEMIHTGSNWFAASEFVPGWTEPDFPDTLWNHAYNEGPAKGLTGNGTNAIWFVNIDKSQLTEQDSSNLLGQISTESTQPIDKLSKVLIRPEKVYFRKSFDVAGLPVSGMLQLFVDDSFFLYLNGQKIAEYRHGQEQNLKTHHFNILEYVKSGRNVLAVEAFDSDSSHGHFEAVLEIKNMPDWSKLRHELEQENVRNSQNLDMN